MRVPVNSQEDVGHEKEKEENAKSTCQFLREESVNGEAAILYSLHREYAEVTEDVRLLREERNQQALEREGDPGGRRALVLVCLDRRGASVVGGDDRLARRDAVLEDLEDPRNGHGRPFHGERSRQLRLVLRDAVDHGLVGGEIVGATTVGGAHLDGWSLWVVGLAKCEAFTR